MNDNLDKIVTYFAEIAERWTSAGGRERLGTLEFFELWERSVGPRPAAVDGATLAAMGVKTLPPLEDGGWTAFLEWDFAATAPALVVERLPMQARYQVGFDDSGAAEFAPPELLELPSLASESDGHGGQVEAVRELVALIRVQNPGLNVLKIKRKDFTAALASLDPPLEPDVAKSLGKLKLEQIHEIVREAVSDMRADELSDQLTLPLDGHYAAAPMVAAAADTDASKQPTGGGSATARRTAGRVMGDMEVLANLEECLARAEEQAYIHLDGAETISEEAGGKGLAIRVKLDEKSKPVGLREGNSMMVVQKGVARKLGEFDIDIIDGELVYGRLRLAPEYAELPFGKLYAVALPSPHKLMADSLRGLRRKVEDDSRMPPSLRAILGLDACQLHLTTPEAAEAAGLDTAQLAAWRGAVNPANPVVVVQGPPGTGKTHVLERIVRTLVSRRNRVLLAAASHAAIDNLCRRLMDLPLLRVGISPRSIAPDVRKTKWAGDLNAVKNFVQARKASGYVFAGTSFAVLKDDGIRDDIDRDGKFDVMIVDEAGMSRLGDFALVAELANRMVAFGDHRQLPPFPIPDEVLRLLSAKMRPFTRSEMLLVERGVLEWLHLERGFPITVLDHSYRCHNPRLLRFASSLFYDAKVKPCVDAEYFRLSYEQIGERYPPSTLAFHRTSKLPGDLRREKVVVEAGVPGIQNETEAKICVRVCLDMARRYPLGEIVVLAPYRRQLRLIRAKLAEAAETAASQGIPAEKWAKFAERAVTTVDSFQGGESDAVVISYTRSGGKTVGFVDDPNRVNVAHTRCRREMAVIGDLDHLKANSGTPIFAQMEKAFARDGIIIDVKPQDL